MRNASLPAQGCGVCATAYTTQHGIELDRGAPGMPNGRATPWWKAGTPKARPGNLLKGILEVQRAMEVAERPCPGG
jgi:hypothetical protein